MTDDERVAPDGSATEEVVQTEVEQTEAPEAAESTEGQEKNPPAEAEKAEDQKTEAQARRERRNAARARQRREAAEAKAELEKANARIARIEEAAKGAQPPKESDFADYNEYLMAAGAYQARLSSADFVRGDVVEEQQKAQERLDMLAEERKQEAAQTWAEQRAEASTRYTDFDKVVFSVPISQDTADLIINSDVGADVAYYLGSNPEKAIELSQLSPVEMAREFGRIEAGIEVPKPRTQSQAPDPVSTVKPKGGAAGDPTKMSISEYRKWRQAGGTF